ncbi:MAG: glutathione S-transferase [Kaistia sp. SCN 65-12]|mgnify:CR=1 FL=1|nr:MAG: glutathione S-transferase [Kaistia sp. SCN 65-12]
MSLTLYLHPLASFCHKVLIALYENGTPFTPRMVDFADDASTAALLDKWPVGKIPVLHDSARDRVIPETSIIIEYLARHYPGPVALLPQDDEARLEARLWDRFFDLYVHVPMQRIVADRLRPEGSKDPFGLAEAHRALDQAYGMIEARLAAGAIVPGEAFTIADCAATPALFYASIVHPFAPDQSRLAAYFEGLIARPSVRRTLDEARPYFHLYPYLELMPRRFRDAAAEGVGG